MRYEQASTLQDLASLPELKLHLTDVRTIHEFWDRVVSGLVDLDGQLRWFEALWDPAADDYLFPRRYVVVEVPATFVSEVESWERRYYAEAWDRERKEPRPGRAAFLEAQHAYRLPPLTGATVLGWTFLSSA